MGKNTAEKTGSTHTGANQQVRKFADTKSPSFINAIKFKSCFVDI